MRQYRRMGLIDDAFVTHVTELLEPFGTISPRRMFGSWGLYRGALMFALVSDDVLYLKCGDHLRELANGAELTLFTYEKTEPPQKKGEKPKKKKVSLNYAAITADLLEDSEMLCRWANAAFNDALAGRKGVSKNAQPGKPRKRPR